MSSPRSHRGPRGGTSAAGRGWLWSNVPIPETLLAAILGGSILHRIVPSRFLSRPHAGRVMGAVTLSGGTILAAWSVAAAGSIDTSEPASLIAAGPYAHTRNPMYLSWALLGVGLALILNNRWLVLTLLAALSYTHLHEIPREERYLLARFPDEYQLYAMRVRRWL